jgi:large subunit ribosomal protein L13
MSKKEVKMTKVVIDAAGKSLGRVATQAANVLRGKNLVTFAPNIVPNVQVFIINIEQLLFTGTKLEVKTYHHYSGYPGGMKTSTLQQEFTKDPVRLVRRSIRGMLPKNRLNSRFLRNLKIYRRGEV